MSCSRIAANAAALTMGAFACSGCTPGQAAAGPPSVTSEASDDRYARGLAKLEQIDGEAGRQVVEGLREIAPDLGRYIIEYPFGDIYQRPGLDLKSREIATVAALTALGHAQPQLAVHLNGALNVGCTRTEVVEVIMQMSVYAGFPAALNGIATAKQVFADRDRRGLKGR
jgi:4-carboxymuconolactone decarboxylase